MLFHVTAQHSWETCRGRKRAESSEDIYPPSEVSRWVEGNDDVKVLAAGGYQSAHRYYAFVEAEEYNSVVQLFLPEMYVGEVEILPMYDMITRRKDAGDWGK